MPNDSISSILGNASERYKLEEAGLKQTGGNYDSNCKTIYEILVRAYAWEYTNIFSAIRGARLVWFVDAPPK